MNQCAFPDSWNEVNMYSTVMTSMLCGIHAIPIRVEVDISTGLPAFEMVGYLSSEVREAKERVRTALHNCGVSLPAKRITINLSPGNIRKVGTGFDLAIAVALLCAMGVLEEDASDGKVFVGELNLNGQILPVNGILPVVSDGIAEGVWDGVTDRTSECMGAGKKQKFLVPMANLAEGQLVKEASVFGFSSLDAVIAFLRDGTYENVNLTNPVEAEASDVDFAEVNGQPYLRRAAEVAASGMHNLLMVGPPGAGKTMISERLATILPPLTEEEKLELSKIYSVCGMLNNRNALLQQRPFRSPHHTVTRAGMTGGGKAPRPGEISLAHHGVLFLDELTEFDKATLEILRQPLEEKQIHLTRALMSVCYPADFLLLASMNPCNCGYYPDMQKCRCSAATLRRYAQKVSQPLIDRIDICVQAPMVTYAELTGKGNNEDSASIQKRVAACHQIQRDRYRNESFHYNSRIPAARMEEFCPLGSKEQAYMEDMYKKMALTARTYHKILRVARTIADCEESRKINVGHLSEAVCYRSMDERFWGGV